MDKNYVDNIRYSLDNQMYINNSIKRNKENKIWEDNHRSILNYNNDRYSDRLNQKYSGYNNYVNGQPYSVIFIPPSTKSFVYNEGINYRNTRLTDSITKEEIDIGGYYMESGKIPAKKIYSNYGFKIKGIL